MKPFLVNRRGRIVLPSNFFPGLDFSVIRDLGQLAEVIKRDFEVKAPTGTEILRRVEDGAYLSRYDLMRDVALNLFWVNRYSITMYDKDVVRWRDVPCTRPTIHLTSSRPARGCRTGSQRRCGSCRRCSGRCCSCAEKFSGKIGSVRTSRMIFGDGAAAMVVAAAGPAPGRRGAPDLCQRAGQRGQLHRLA